jgi:predicted KAP-like P-loop ATPase
MDGILIVYSLIALGIGFFLAFTTSLYAIARLRKFEKSVSDIEWDDLADLVIDVGKLKRNAQKYQSNVNAAQKLTQKEKLAMAIDQAQQVVPMRYTNNINMER